MRQIKQFFYRLARAIRWGVFMFHNEEWDYAFFQKLIIKRLQNLEEYYAKHSGVMESPMIAKQIRVARKCFEVAIDDTNSDERQDKYRDLGLAIMKKYLPYWWD